MFDLTTCTLSEYADGYGKFISDSPSSYHAASVVAERLASAGFTRVDEREVFTGVERGFIQRAGAVIAWQLPDEFEQSTGVRIIASHTDSPSFKIKPNADSENAGHSQVNVEVYGGPLLNSWLNRDLGIAGQITTIDGHTHLVRTGPVMTIPQLAPHLDRSQNNNLELSRQRDYHPIWSVSGGSIIDYVCEQAGIGPSRVAGTDLYSYDVADYQMYGGAGGADLFVAPRQDNLSSVYAALQAFLSVESVDEAGAPVGLKGEPAPHDILVFAAFDHEEIGSTSAYGAAGPFLETVLRRIVAAQGIAGNAMLGASVEEAYWRLLANSSCISADVGHAVSPNKVEKHDPAHLVRLGNGMLVKINAQQRYATDAQGVQLVLRAAAHAGEAVQEIVSNNDVPAGSTIGPFIASRLGITTVDVGAPILSMHSIREITNPDDLLGMARIFHSYYVD
ncbi:MAG: M18 family aminopeptidase [Actinomycetaceae bacterium]|nr:M18 family aminopeptidase [Actinomycetaceae bacterium]